MTSSKLAPSKTMDANGWMVYNYGTFKDYVYRRNDSPSGSIPSGGIWDLSSIPVPVGVQVFNDLYWQVGGTGGAKSLIITTWSSGSADTITPNLSNMSNTSVPIGSVSIVVFAKSK